MRAIVASVMARMPAERGWPSIAAIFTKVAAASMSPRMISISGDGVISTRTHAVGEELDIGDDGLFARADIPWGVRGRHWQRSSKPSRAWRSSERSSVNLFQCFMRLGINNIGLF